MKTFLESIRLQYIALWRLKIGWIFEIPCNIIAPFIPTLKTFQVVLKVDFRIWHISSYLTNYHVNSERLLTSDMVSSVWHEVSVISLHRTTCSFSVLVMSYSSSSTLFFKILHSFCKDSARFVWISPSCLDFRRVSFREEIYKLRACTKHFSLFVLLCFVQ